MNHIPEVRQFVIDNFLFGEDNPQIKNDTSFRDMSLMDSTGILELVDFLEETYEIDVDEDELTPENFDSFEKIDQFINQKQGR